MPDSRLPKTIRTRVAVERATSSKCHDCGHLWDYHHAARSLCVGSPVCGCAKFDHGTPTPAQFDERWIDSAEAVDRSIS